MRTPTQMKKPQQAKLASFPAPTGGWVANRNLAIGRDPKLPPGAAVLENMFPTATGAVLRRGFRRWASVTNDTPIRAMFTYVAGNKNELFAATGDAVYNITTVPSPYTWVMTPGDGDYLSTDPAAEEAIGEESLVGLDVLTGQTGGDWSVVQFATAGGVFLIGVNGSDPGFLYNGTTFAATTITFPSGSPLTTADLAYVWVYQKRLFFIQKNSLSAWYLPVDSIGGEMTELPLGAVFVRGGTLLWGQPWSLYNSNAGNLSDQCTFCTTEGEVAVYQGLNPSSATDWTKVGVYRIGRPMGRKGLIRAGGDLVVATTVGFISLNSAAQSDYAALGRGAVSYPIEDEWINAVLERGDSDWRCQVWPDGRMALIAPPTPVGFDPVVYVSNTNTGAWCKFTGWDITALEVFQGGIFFGSSGGEVRQGWVGGSDEGNSYVGSYLPLFEDFGEPGSSKIVHMGRATIRSAYAVREKIEARFNFNMSMPVAPSQANIPVGNDWDSGTWDASTWDAARNTVVQANWRSLGGSGHDVSVAFLITSGGEVPIDAEVVRLDVTYTAAGLAT